MSTASPRATASYVFTCRLRPGGQPSEVARRLQRRTVLRVAWEEPREAGTVLVGRAVTHDPGESEAIHEALVVAAQFGSRFRTSAPTIHSGVWTLSFQVAAEDLAAAGIEGVVSLEIAVEVVPPEGRIS